MFNKKSKVDQNPKLTVKVDHDLVVHNMPSISKFGRTFSNKSSAPMFVGVQNTINSNKPKKNFKIMGLIIMLAGIIFIGALVYLSYIFIIKPTLNTKKPLTSTNISNKKSNRPISNNATVPLATSTINSQIATVTPNSVNSITPIKLTTASATTVVTSTQVKLATSSSTASSLTPLLDSDHDGLNNFEEAVLGTSPTSSDTNHNGYPDLVEVDNNYNPIGTGRLKADTNLATYYNKIFNYQLLYPKAWPMQSVNQQATIIFTAPDESLIQISVEDNSKKLSILDWYKSLFPKINPAQDKFKTNKNWEGISGPDNLNFYLTGKQHSKIFIISYIPALSGRIVYPNIFKLMINSLLIK